MLRLEVRLKMVKRIQKKSPKKLCVILGWVIISEVQFNSSHSVRKSHKKSHSTLRAKRATFTLLVNKSSLKMTKSNSKIQMRQFE